MCAAAQPSFSAVSAVTGSTFATPRTPSVPKIFFACATVVTLNGKVAPASRSALDRFPRGFQFVNFTMQRPPADPEFLCCFGNVPVRSRQGLHYQTFLCFVKIERARLFAERFRWCDASRQVRGGYAADIRRKITQG